MKKTRREVMMLANLQSAIQPLVCSSDSKEDVQQKLRVVLDQIILYMGRSISKRKIALTEEGGLRALIIRKHSYERSPCGYYVLEEVKNTDDGITFKWVLSSDKDYDSVAQSEHRG